MRWVDTTEGLNFATTKQRDFVIDSLVRFGVFNELLASFIEQRKTASTLLQVPPTRAREIGQYISMYETNFDRDLDAGKPYAEIPHKIDTPSLWHQFWLERLGQLKEIIQEHIKAKVDFESLNKHVWYEVRHLIMQAGMDAHRLRTERYGRDAGRKPKWLQRIIWWFRTRALEWKWGKKKILYGTYERYDTDEGHDPAKLVVIQCGYCGTTIRDNSMRPAHLHRFDPTIFEINKGNEKVTISSTSSISKYDRVIECPTCKERLGNAYVNKVARAVMVVLL